MPNYIIRGCLAEDTIIISAGTLTVGTSISYGIGDDQPFCGTVIDETNDPITENSYLIDEFPDCCDCLRSYTESINFSFTVCETGQVINIEATEFCNDNVVPIIDSVYQIQPGASRDPFCATFKGLASSGVTNYSYVSGPYSSCTECLYPSPTPTPTPTPTVTATPSVTGENTPTPTVTITNTPTPSFTSQFIIQVGPGYEECNVCYNSTGNTVSSVSVPHAVWTNNQGIAVEQMNSVQLGGMNGLNN